MTMSIWLSISFGIKSRNIDLNSWNTLYNTAHGLYMLDNNVYNTRFQYKICIVFRQKQRLRERIKY